MPREQTLKITLTQPQVTEIRTKAQALQNEAYQRYIEARDRYNKIVERLHTGEVELVTLVELTAGLPDATPATSPVSVSSRLNTERYFAYSRSGRRENGGLAVHDISVTKPRFGGTVESVSCTCPGFRNHGYCWASTEAKRQVNAGSTAKSGTNGVWKRT
jgi:hypothetical protein